MSLDSDYVAKVTTPKQSGGYLRGTAYPIREGVIITAYHVIPDIKNYQQTYLVWDAQDDNDKKFITDILYESKDNDVVIAECQTPLNLPKITLCKDRPSSTQNWDSFGYARSATDIEQKKHKLESAGGTYYKTPNNSEVQQLSAKDNASDNKFWKGMSGAPIFTADSDFLIGIFIETSLVYEDEEGKNQPVFKGRLRAASIAYLLENDQDDKFAEAVYGKDYRNYKNKGKEKLQAHLEKLKKATPHLCNQLPELDDLLSSLNKDTITCIRDLKKKCAGQHSTEIQTQIETFFYLLLSQLDVPCNWEGKHLHELQVSTRLLAELSISRLYNVIPKFSDSDSLIGKHVLPASQKELGFDIKDEAEEQANTVAYALYKRWGNEGLTKEALMEAPNHFEGVNEDILLQREDDEKIYRFEINARSEEALDGEHPLLIQEVRNHLQKLLPDLPIVIYGGSTDSVVANEERIQTNVRSFIKKIIRSE